MMEITAQMRENKKIEFKDQLKIVILLSVPAILEQLVGTAMSYIDTAMVGSLGYKATAAIGVVASTTWLFGGICTATVLGFSVQVAQYLGAGKNKLARQVVCQSILFNIIFFIRFFIEFTISITNIFFCQIKSPSLRFDDLLTMNHLLLPQIFDYIPNGTD